MSQTRTIPRAFARRSQLEAASATERHVLDVIRRHGPITRADIARRVGLSGMSVTRLADELERRNLIRNTGRIGGGRGLSIGIELVPNSVFCIGISIMTDVVSVCLMDLSGAIVAEHRRVARDMRQAVAIAATAEIVDRLVAKHVPDRDRLFGAGVAISGFFIGDGSKVNPPDPLEEWALVDVEGILHERLKLPVWVDNDGNAAAEAEAMFGVGRWANSFAYLYFAAGFGGGIIHDGRLLRGKNGNAGEFAGAIPLEGYQHPNLENLRRLVAKKHPEILTIADLLKAFDPTWPQIDAWLSAVQPALNIAVSAASAVLDPDAIVLGGRIPKQLAERIIVSLKFSSAPRRGVIRPVPHVVTAETVGDPSAIGAAVIPLKAHFFSP